MNDALIRELEQIRHRWRDRKASGKTLDKKLKCDKIKVTGSQNQDGGPGSGNHGHAGVPGVRGGSAPRGTTTTKISYKQCKQGKAGSLKMYDAFYKVMYPNGYNNTTDGTTIKVSVGGKPVLGGENSRGLLKYNKSKKVWADVDTGKEYSAYDVLACATSAYGKRKDVTVSVNENREVPKAAKKSAKRASERKATGESSGTISKGRTLQTRLT